MFTRAVYLSATVITLGACHGPPRRLEPRPLPELETELAPGDLVGFVLDSATGLPIANAMIILRHDSAASSASLPPSRGALTDSLGRFYIRTVPPGSYTLIARFIGYRQRLLSVGLTDSTAAVVTLALGRDFAFCPQPVPKGTLCY